MRGVGIESSGQRSRDDEVGYESLSYSYGLFRRVVASRGVIDKLDRVRQSQCMGENRNQVG